MQEMEVTFTRAARIWWAWLWRTVLATMLASAALGLAVGLAAHLLPRLFASGAGFGRIACGAAGCLIGIGMMRRVLRGHFGGFRVVLVKHQKYFSAPF